MLQLDSPEVRQIILKGLKKADRVDDIALIVCENTGVPWQQACAFIEKVSVESKDEITMSPLLLTLTVGMFLSGVALLLYTLSFFVYGVYLGNNQLISAVGNFEEAGGISPLEATVLGFALIIGGWKGMAEVWEIVLKKTNLL